MLERLHSFVWQWVSKYRRDCIDVQQRQFLFQFEHCLDWLWVIEGVSEWEIDLLFFLFIFFNFFFLDHFDLSEWFF